MKKTLLILLSFLSFSLYAQKDREMISGMVKDASKPVINAHIVNLTSKRGSLSDKNGEFQINVKVNDTLQITDIQYKTRIVIISQKHLIKGKLYIRMFQKNNQLDEVIVETTNMAEALGLPNAGKKPLEPIERKINFIQKGGNITKIYAWISGEKKRLKILQKRMAEDDLALNNKIDVELIREHFGDDFFRETIELPIEEIDNFLMFCIPNGIGKLYEQDRYMEIVDILIKRKEPYLSSLK